MPKQPSRDGADEFAWAGPALKPRLQADPRAVLKDRGWEVPPGLPLPLVHEFARVALLLWVDGERVPVDEFRIDPADEGLLFGRGVWESTRTFGGRPWLWNLHLERLRTSADALRIALAPESLPNAEQVADFVQSLTTQDVLVRLNATAGRPGGRGLAWMSAAPLPLSAPPLRLKSRRNPVENGQPYLTLKTFQYATRLRIGQEAAGDGFDSALLVGADGLVQEAAHANIFFRFPDGWATPRADRGGLLQGTVRRLLLERAPVSIRAADIPYSALGEAREAFVTNSNVGIMPVMQIDAWQYPVGPETPDLMEWIAGPEPSTPQVRFVEHGGMPR